MAVALEVLVLSKAPVKMAAVLYTAALAVVLVVGMNFLLVAFL
jgi:hypothetical protein